MHRFWDHLIWPMFEIVRPRTVVEIGSGEGTCTKKILTYCERSGATIHAIDPTPTAWRGPHDALVFHSDISLNVLPRLDHYDAVLIDGDHNWYTVHHELLLIEKNAKQSPSPSFPLVFLHDTGWPYGRRDLYYAPERIPDFYRKAYTRGGLLPNHGLPAPGGINEHDHWHSIEENTIRNGVLTAVEDFLEESHEPLRFVNIPGMHGIGILAPSSLLALYPALDRFLSELTPTRTLSSHISTIEENRIHSIRSEEQLKRNLIGNEANVVRLCEERRVMEETMREKEKCMEETMKEKEKCIEHLKKELRQHQGHITEQQTIIEQILQSRSYRWTSPFRYIGQYFHQLPYHLFAALKDIWSDFGEPFPHLVQTVRHRLLGRVWPPTQQYLIPSLSVPSQPKKESTPINNVKEHVAIIVLCHNNGKLLPTTIESILSQTLKPSEIVVVDDDSGDETKNIAINYARKGVEYLHGSWRNRNAARNAGLACSESPLLVFLASGDKLSPDYLQSCAAMLSKNPGAAIAYMDGSPYPFDQTRFEQKNTIPDIAMVRREALQAVGGWPQGLQSNAEWITWRRILANGWKAMKIPCTEQHSSLSHGTLAQRCHPEPVALRGPQGDRVSIVRQAHHDTHLDATLCLSISGRKWMWPLTADFLTHQTYPHDQLHLVVVDTSQDKIFGQMVQEWLRCCNYEKRTYIPLSVGIKGLADLPRRTVKREVAKACAIIYNTFVPHCTTPWIFFLEDDVIPPLNAYPQLLQHFAEGIASVSALCMQRLSPHPIVWEWDHDGMPAKIPEAQEGITTVGGNGFCCVAIRGELIRETLFHSGPFDFCHDHNFYYQITRERRRKALMDWSCVCRHYVSPHEWK